jgi:hypothetical protein
VFAGAGVAGFDVADEIAIRTPPLLHVGRQQITFARHHEGMRKPLILQSFFS